MIQLHSLVRAIAIMGCGLTAPVTCAIGAQLDGTMQKLDWMVGKWEGTGWIESAESGKRDFSYSLNVRPAFDGRLLIVDGVGHERESDWLPYAEHVLISKAPDSPLPGPPGTYSWQEVPSTLFVRANEAQGTDRSLQVGYGFTRHECDQTVADAARRAICRTGEMKWSRVTIQLNDAGEWVQTREWQEMPGDDRSWHTYFKVILRRVDTATEARRSP